MIKKPSDHIKTKFDKIGVLLINLGTPENTDYWSMRKYLKEFLSDKRVIDVFKPLWWIILNGPILALRPQKSGKAYNRIWDPKKGSPLRYITESQLKKVQTQFKSNKSIIFDYSMRYGKPSINEKLEHLFHKGCSKLLILPLYPQYSASTTASVQDQVFKWLLNKRWQPSIRTVAPWFDDDNYIGNLTKTIEKSFIERGAPEHLIVSFHGVPRRYLLLGDPYHCHCQKTGRLIKEKLNWPDNKFTVSFQSRFGPEEWLTPYTDEKIIELAKHGIKKISIISPGFVTDCLETLDEIKNEALEIFLEHGGKELNYINCLNDGKEGISLLSKLIYENLKGWT